MDVNPDEVLFVGLGNSIPNWYRCAVPAMALGCHWVGVTDDFKVLCGNITKPKWDTYKVYIVEYMAGQHWRDFVLKQRARGAKVLFEVDDYLHSAYYQEGLQFREYFSPQAMKRYEMVMAACDGLIATTPFIVEKYKHFVDGRAWVCETGLHLDRYDLEYPHRDTLQIGWAGGLGHREAVWQWIPAVEAILDEYEGVSMVTIGDTPAEKLRFPAKLLQLPSTTMENYPPALTHIDINLAPTTSSEWYQGKSDLRWQEGAALGTPTIAGPGPYDRLPNEVVKRADNAEEVYNQLVEWVEDHQKMSDFGEAAKDYVRNNRGIQHTASQWITAIEEVTE